MTQPAVSLFSNQLHFVIKSMKLNTISANSPIEIIVAIILFLCLSVFQTINVNKPCTPIAKDSNRSKTGPQIQLFLFRSRIYVTIVNTTKPIVKIVTIHSVVRLSCICISVTAINTITESRKYSKYRFGYLGSILIG